MSPSTSSTTEPMDTIHAVGKAIVKVLKHSCNGNFVNDVFTKLQANDANEADRHIGHCLWLTLHKQQGVVIPSDIHREITFKIRQQKIEHIEHIFSSDQEPFIEYESSQNNSQEFYLNEDQSLQERYSPFLDIERNADYEKDYEEAIPIPIAYDENIFYDENLVGDGNAASTPHSINRAYDSQVQELLPSPIFNQRSRKLNQSPDVEILRLEGGEMLGQSQDLDAYGELSSLRLSSCIQDSSISDPSIIFSGNKCLEESQLLADVNSLYDDHNSKVDHEELQQSKPKLELTHCIDEAMTLLAENTCLQGSGLPLSERVDYALFEISGNLSRNAASSSDLQKPQILAPRIDALQDYFGRDQKYQGYASDKAMNQGGYQSSLDKRDSSRDILCDPIADKRDEYGKWINSGNLDTESIFDNRHTHAKRGDKKQTISYSDMVDKALMRLSNKSAMYCDPVYEPFLQMNSSRHLSEQYKNKIFNCPVPNKLQSNRNTKVSVLRPFTEMSGGDSHSFYHVKNVSKEEQRSKEKQKPSCSEMVDIAIRRLACSSQYIANDVYTKDAPKERRSIERLHGQGNRSAVTFNQMTEEQKYESCNSSIQQSQTLSLIDRKSNSSLSKSIDGHSSQYTASDVHTKAVPKERQSKEGLHGQGNRSAVIFNQMTEKQKYKSSNSSIQQSQTLSLVDRKSNSSLSRNIDGPSSQYTASDVHTKDALKERQSKEGLHGQGNRSAVIFNQMTEGQKYESSNSSIQQSQTLSLVDKTSDSSLARSIDCPSSQYTASDVHTKAVQKERQSKEWLHGQGNISAVLFNQTTEGQKYESCNSSIQQSQTLSLVDKKSDSLLSRSIDDPIIAINNNVSGYRLKSTSKMMMIDTLPHRKTELNNSFKMENPSEEHNVISSICENNLCDGFDINLSFDEEDIEGVKRLVADDTVPSQNSLEFNGENSESCITSTFNDNALGRISEHPQSNHKATTSLHKSCSLKDSTITVDDASVSILHPTKSEDIKAVQNDTMVSCNLEMVTLKSTISETENNTNIDVNDLPSSNSLRMHKTSNTDQERIDNEAVGLRSVICHGDKPTLSESKEKSGDECDLSAFAITGKPLLTSSPFVQLKPNSGRPVSFSDEKVVAALALDLSKPYPLMKDGNFIERNEKNLIDEEENTKRKSPWEGKPNAGIVGEQMSEETTADESGPLIKGMSFDTLLNLSLPLGCEPLDKDLYTEAHSIFRDRSNKFVQNETHEHTACMTYLPETESFLDTSSKATNAKNLQNLHLAFNGKQNNSRNDKNYETNLHVSKDSVNNERCKNTQNIVSKKVASSSEDRCKKSKKPTRRSLFAKSSGDTKQDVNKTQNRKRKKKYKLTPNTSSCQGECPSLENSGTKQTICGNIVEKDCEQTRQMTSEEQNSYSWFTDMTSSLSSLLESYPSMNMSSVAGSIVHSLEDICTSNEILEEQGFNQYSESILTTLGSDISTSNDNVPLSIERNPPELLSYIPDVLNQEQANPSSCSLDSTSVKTITSDVQALNAGDVIRSNSQQTNKEHPTSRTMNDVARTEDGNASWAVQTDGCDIIPKYNEECPLLNECNSKVDISETKGMPTSSQYHGLMCHSRKSVEHLKFPIRQRQDGSNSKDSCGKSSIDSHEMTNSSLILLSSTPSITNQEQSHLSSCTSNYLNSTPIGGCKSADYKFVSDMQALTAEVESSITKDADKQHSTSGTIKDVAGIKDGHASRAVFTEGCESITDYMPNEEPPSLNECNGKVNILKPKRMSTSPQYHGLTSLSRKSEEHLKFPIRERKNSPISKDWNPSSCGNYTRDSHEMTKSSLVLPTNIPSITNQEHSNPSLCTLNSLNSTSLGGSKSALISDMQELNTKVDSSSDEDADRQHLISGTMNIVAGTKDGCTSQAVLTDSITEYKPNEEPPSLNECNGEVNISKPKGMSTRTQSHRLTSSSREVEEILEYPMREIRESPVSRDWEPSSSGKYITDSNEMNKSFLDYLVSEFFPVQFSQNIDILENSEELAESAALCELPPDDNVLLGRLVSEYDVSTYESHLEIVDEKENTKTSNNSTVRSLKNSNPSDSFDRTVIDTCSFTDLENIGTDALQSNQHLEKTGTSTHLINSDKDVLQSSCSFEETSTVHLKNSSHDSLHSDQLVNAARKPITEVASSQGLVTSLQGSEESIGDSLHQEKTVSISECNDALKRQDFVDITPDIIFVQQNVSNECSNTNQITKYTTHQESVKLDDASDVPKDKNSFDDTTCLENDVSMMSVSYNVQEISGCCKKSDRGDEVEDIMEWENNLGSKNASSEKFRIFKIESGLDEQMDWE